jgi:adenylate kinase family enzyme
MKGGDDTLNEEQYNVALMLEQHLKEDWGYTNFVTISVGDLLQKEITKKSDFGKRIFESRKKYKYVDDEIVIDLVTKHILECEKEMNSED